MARRLSVSSLMPTTRHLGGAARELCARLTADEFDTDTEGTVFDHPAFAHRVPAENALPRA